IISHFNKIGFDTLPVILWRKQTNAPNKFMGSGMLPSGAYVTLEHEYILIFRKGSKKKFKSSVEKQKRMESAFFWEERNCWFSDIWDFKGVTQILNHKALRKRSAAYPLELAYRLTNMYSLYNDVILDPFIGTGTTILAGILCGRNTIGVEIDKEFTQLISNQITGFLSTANQLTINRLKNHIDFVKNRTKEKGSLKYSNIHHGFKVMTKQETGIQLKYLLSIKQISSSEYSALYENIGNLQYDTQIEKECERLKSQIEKKEKKAEKIEKFLAENNPKHMLSRL
ncbi:MAG: site-specific DNA-methyltransferase, partial [Spirochaetota bacterium]|nr:site-specific DNA-methyltransferase [Spirochaetota bacterium]